MTHQQARVWAEEVFEKAGIKEAGNDAFLLLCDCAKLTPTSFLLKKNEELPQEVFSAFEKAVRLRESRLPLQHITGEQVFMGFPMKVTKDVLIPRFDTEVLVEEVLHLLGNLTKEGRQPRVLDMCTGSGCIIISLKKLCPGIVACGSDVSEKALKVAEENAASNGAEVDFYCSNLFEKLPGQFELIVSNPPYIKTKVIDTLDEEVRRHEPMLALDGKEDGLFFYREIIDKAKERLSDNGCLCFEIGHDQGEEVSLLLRHAGYEGICVKKDLAGMDRVVIARKG